MISFLNRYYGTFTPQELKKYLTLGGIFALCIGLIWSLMPLRDTLFCNLVIGFGECAGRQTREVYIAWARIVALVLMVPAVAVYDYCASRTSRRSSVIALSGVYVVLLAIFGIYFWLTQAVEAVANPSAWAISAWLWYALVESLNALFIAAYWGLMIDVCDEAGAHKSFGLILMIGQLGGICMPALFNAALRHTVINPAGLIVCAALVMATIGWLISRFVRTTDASLLRGYRSSTRETVQRSSGLSGLKLVLHTGYLRSLLVMIVCFESVITLLDYTFKITTFSSFATLEQASAFLAQYASLVNLVTFVLLAGGITRINRFLGLRASFILLFVSVICCIAGFIALPGLHMLLALLLITKALNYALKVPSVKQLYVPTSQSTQYNAQSWIETAGSGTAKMVTAFVGSSKGALGPTFYLALSSSMSLGAMTVWLIAALYVARIYTQAVESKKTIC